MKHLWFLLALFALAAPAAAAPICSSVPYTFVNGTTADATQVNANFAAILSCVNAAAAHNGANTDITSLGALTAPPAGNGSLVFSGGTATGTANAIAIGATTPTGFTLTAGRMLTFLASAANTTATTITVGGLSTVSLVKNNATSIVPLSGGEIGFAGQVVTAIYDGTEFVLLSQPVNIPALPSGVVAAFNLNSCPTGWLTANGTSSTADMRGTVARGLDLGAGRDTSGTGLAGYEQDFLINFVVSTGFLGQIVGSSGGGIAITSVQNYPGSTGNAVSSEPSTTVGNETRVKSTVLLYCQKQ